ncbi:NUDIX hydrolase [Frankia sp. Cr2]|uniref:NUDIX hydrolase n=1 Tax=Frankia sp. Cr2 TaxID=3073932 RepID=UPI002AD328A3|nr:NUDIX hydrolase [Frankia sp. Cr2]
MDLDDDVHGAVDSRQTPNPAPDNDGLVRVVRRAARAILIDSRGRLVVFRRTLPGQQPYWATVGGGVDQQDASVEAALHRELAEELGAAVDRVQQVFLTSTTKTSTAKHRGGSGGAGGGGGCGPGITVQHFFVCRLTSMDLAARTGDEFTNPTKGRYDVERIDLHGEDLTRFALQPDALKDFILANREALLAAVADPTADPTADPPARR